VVIFFRIIRNVFAGLGKKLSEEALWSFTLAKSGEPAKSVLRDDRKEG